MAKNNSVANSGAQNNDTKITTVKSASGDFSYKRDRAQTMTFAKM